MRFVRPIVAVGILSAVLGATALAFTLQVSEDTSAHARKGTLTASAGAARNLVASSTRPALVRFDLSRLPAGVTADTITSVTLRLYVRRANGSAADVSVLPVTSEWHETDDGAVPTTNAGGGVLVPGPVRSSSFVSADVTAAVRSALRGGPDFGFHVTTSAGTIVLGAKEGPGTGYAAVLDVESDPVPATLAPASVNSETISDGSVTTAKLGGGSVTSASLADGSVTAAKLGGGAVTSATLADGSVTTAKLGAGSVASATLADGSVTTAKLGSGSVTSATLADGSVTSAKLASGLTLGGTTAISGILTLPATTGASTGVIYMGGSRVLHQFGSSGRSFFAGTEAGNFSQSGQTNTGVGYRALVATSSGGGNTAVGTEALSKTTTGSVNTAVGVFALRDSVSGDGNTALGYLALWLTTGSNNIAIGADAGGSLTTGSNNINIGRSVSGGAGESSTIRIGGANQTRNFTAGIRGVTTGAADAVAVVIDSNGQLGTVSSSRRYKEDVADMGQMSARIHALRPVTFRYTRPYADGPKPVQFGLIAEEVAATFPELAVFDAEGRPETVKYHDLVPMLLNELLVANRRADAQAATIAAQQQEVGALAEKLAALEHRDREREERLARIERALDGSHAGADVVR